MRETKFYYAVLISALIGCSSPSITPVKTQTIHLSDIEAFQSGKTSTEVIAKKFGEAPVQVSNEKKNQVSWLYFLQNNPRRQRINFIFDRSTLVLKEMDWFVQENESEHDLSKTLSLHGNHFKKHTIEWQQVDFISSKTTYVDNGKGLRVSVYEGYPNNVSSISWTTPGSIDERDGFIGFFKNQQRDDWQVIVDRRELRSPANSK